MDNVDIIFVSMNAETKDALRKNLEEYKTTGDANAKRVVLKILGEYDDARAVREYLKSL